MINVRPIRPNEIVPARRMILKVAYGIYGWKGTLEDSIRHFESSGEFADMDNVQANYFDNDGLFLAAFDDDKIIGTGAIRKMDVTHCELKRMWLLEEYQGMGIGFSIFRRLLEFARGKGYRFIRLQTGPEQTRALDFYKRLGFYEIACYNDQKREISMELAVEGTRFA